MWSHWQNETHFTQHARGSWSLLSSPHCLLLKRPTHMHALTVAKISALTVLSRAVLLLCRQTKQAELLWCASPPDQSRPAKPSRLLQLVCACLHQLRIWLCYTWQWPSSRATLPSQAKSWKIDVQPKCGAVLQVHATANGTSRRILTGLDLSHPYSTDPALIWFSVLIFPPSPLRLLGNMMPYIVSICWKTVILTSIHQCPL